MPMSERTRPHSLSTQLLLVFIVANLCTALVAMPSARNFFREIAEGEGGGIGLGGGGGGRGSGSIPGRRQEDGDIQVVRFFRLLNRCSQKYVRLTSKHIDAKAMVDSIYSQLRVVSEEFGSLLRIQSSQTHSYLCFNKRGKLTVKHLGKDGGCVFREIHTADHFTEYQSAVNDTWFLSFRKTGQAMDAGHEWNRRSGSQRCRHFTKTQFAYLDSAGGPHQLGGPPGRDTTASPSLPVNPSAVNYHRAFVRLGTPDKSQQSEASFRRTTVGGHQSETTSMKSPVKGHHMEVSTSRSILRGHKSEGSKRRLPVRGQRSEASNYRSAVTVNHSQDTNRRPLVGATTRRPQLGIETTEATIPRSQVEGHESEAT